MINVIPLECQEGAEDSITALILPIKCKKAVIGKHTLLQSAFRLKAAERRQNGKATTPAIKLIDHFRSSLSSRSLGLKGTIRSGQAKNESS